MSALPQPAALTVGLTRFANARTTSGKFQTAVWGKIVAVASTPTGVYLVDPKGEPPEKAKLRLPLVKLAQFEGDTREHGSPGPKTVWGVEGDYDAGRVTVATAASLLKAAGIRALIYSTARHVVEAPRWRVIVPLTASAPIDHRAALLRRVDEALGNILASESYEPTRSYFLGAIDGVVYEWAEVDGEPLDAFVSDLEVEAAGEYLPAKKNAPVPAGEAADPANDPLLVALHIHGMLGRYNGGAEWNVECPNLAQHSDGRGDGTDDSAVVYARANASYGFKCQHMHCQGPSRDYPDAKRITLTDLINAARAQDAINQRRCEIAFEQQKEARAIGEGTDAVDTVFPVMTEEQMREQFVFVGDGSRVVRRGYRGASLSFADFQKATQSSFVTVDKGRRVQVANRWLQHPQRLYAQTVTFAPGQPEFCRSPDGAPALNLWHPRPHREGINAAHAQPFLDHVEYLVPIAAEREDFLNWLAHIEQVPGQLPANHYLMITKQTGIGRNWLASLLARVWAGNVALNLDLVAMLDGSFNGRLAGKVLAVVDELLEGVGRAQDKARRADKLKSMLTEETRLINPKYGHQHVEFNCCRFLMFSNHDAALPLGRNDRRVVVISNPTQRKDAEYFTHLYGLLDDPAFVASVRQYLRTRPLAGYNPSKPAVENAAKLRVVSAGENDLVASVRDVVETWSSDIISAGTLKKRVVDFSERVSTQQLSAAYHEAGLSVHPRKVRVDNRVERVWIIRNVDKWITSSTWEVAAEVRVGGELAD